MNSRSCRRVQVFNPEYTHEKCRALLQKFDKDRDSSIQLRSALVGPIVSGLSECADLAIVCAPIGDSGGVMVPGSGLLFSESSYRGFPGQRQRRSAHTCMCACVHARARVCVHIHIHIHHALAPITKACSNMCPPARMPARPPTRPQGCTCMRALTHSRPGDRSPQGMCSNYISAWPTACPLCG